MEDTPDLTPPTTDDAAILDLAEAEIVLPEPRLHVMVDLETLGKAPDGLILAIGAAAFDPHSTEIVQSFYQRVEPRSAQVAGMHIDADTVMWWLDPERAAAREALFATEPIELWYALEGLGSWLDSLCVRKGDTVQHPPIWGNGADFDLTILQTAFEKCNSLAPWSYRDVRCFRTLKALFPKIDVPDVGTGHQARNDAIWQAQYVQQLVQRHGLPL